MPVQIFRTTVPRLHVFMSTELCMIYTDEIFQCYIQERLTQIIPDDSSIFGRIIQEINTC